jgi:alkanesulfonate monooxygenase SsuD/methylene tetrahydromethanopterin reductase-like flavin-dependent oxidoreductase (luciferase family)
MSRRMPQALRLHGPQVEYVGKLIKQAKRRVLWKFAFDGDHDDHSVDHLFSWDLGVQGGTILFGAPATVRGQVDKLLEESGCNYFIGSFAWGSLPMSASERSLELFAEHVMPHYAS